MDTAHGVGMGGGWGGGEARKYIHSVMTTDITGLTFHFISFHSAREANKAALSCLQYTCREGFDFLAFSSLFHAYGKENRGKRFTVAKWWAGTYRSFAFLSSRLGFLMKLKSHVSLKENGSL